MVSNIFIFTLFIKNLSLFLWYLYITVPEGGIFLSQVELLANEIADKISSKNGEPFTYENQEIPLYLHVGILKLESKHLRYAELFEKLHNSIKESK